MKKKIFDIFLYFGVIGIMLFILIFLPNIFNDKNLIFDEYSSYLSHHHEFYKLSKNLPSKNYKNDIGSLSNANEKKCDVNCANKCHEIYDEKDYLFIKCLNQCNCENSI